MTKEEQFLKELAELSKKYNLFIDGCCGSFIVYSPDDGQVLKARVIQTNCEKA